MSKFTIFLDFGHGGKDPGASGNGVKEKNEALSIGLEIGKILNQQGIKVLYSRTTDVFLELHERAIKANRASVDMFVSIHLNSASNTQANGVETYHFPNSKGGKQLATDIQNQLVSDSIFNSDRGVKSSNFAVLRRTKMKSALVELGFVSNKSDVKIVQTKRNQIAVSLAKGIMKNLGVDYVSNNKSDNKPSKWAEQSWQWGIDNGITDGNRPHDTATREEVVALLDKALTLKK